MNYVTAIKQFCAFLFFKAAQEIQIRIKYCSAPKKITT